MYRQRRYAPTVKGYLRYQLLRWSKRSGPIRLGFPNHCGILQVYELVNTWGSGLDSSRFSTIEINRVDFRFPTLPNALGHPPPRQLSSSAYQPHPIPKLSPGCPGPTQHRSIRQGYTSKTPRHQPPCQISLRWTMATPYQALTPPSTMDPRSGSGVRVPPPFSSSWSADISAIFFPFISILFALSRQSSPPLRDSSYQSRPCWNPLRNGANNRYPIWM